MTQSWTPRSVAWRPGVARAGGGGQGRLGGEGRQAAGRSGKPEEGRQGGGWQAEGRATAR